MKKIIFLFACLLLVNLINAYPVVLQSCSVNNTLSFNTTTNAIDGNVSLTCSNYTIDIPLNASNVSYFTINNYTYINNTGNYTVYNYTNYTYYLNVTNYTYYNNASNLTDYFYPKSEADSRFIDTGEINNYNFVRATQFNLSDVNISGMQEKLDKLNDEMESSRFYYGVILIIVGVIALIGAGLGAKNFMGG